jgi:energy-coupling factor transporter ATP-binding protein EcfA2
LQYADANGDYQLQDAIRWRIDVLVNDRQPRDIATPTGTVPFVIYQRFWHMVHFGRNQSICMKWLETRKTASAWWVKPRVLQVFHAPRTSILLVGHTGTGKSTLFRAITSRYAATTNGSKPTTKAIQTDNCQWKDGSIVECIDTPGFGDDTWSDYDGLKSLAKFLEQRYKSRTMLTSVFYLIDISGTKIDASALRQANALRALIGDDVWSNAAFIFTHATAEDMKPGPKQRVAAKKEKDLKRRWRTEIFPEAKENGALFLDLGLDISDFNEMELAEEADRDPAEEDDKPTDGKHGGSGSESESSLPGHSEDEAGSASEPGVLDSEDLSTNRSSAFRGVQHEIGMFAHSWNTDRS